MVLVTGAAVLDTEWLLVTAFVSVVVAAAAASTDSGSTEGTAIVVVVDTAGVLLDLPFLVLTGFFTGDLATGVGGGWFRLNPPGSSSGKS